MQGSNPDKDREVPRNVNLFAIHPPGAALGPGIFYLRDISILQNVQADAGAHQASYPKGTGILSRW